MKIVKMLLVLILIVSMCKMYGQNVFPSTGKVGIGTVQPMGILDVYQSSGAVSTSGATTLISSFGLSGGVHNVINRRLWGLRGTNASDDWKTMKLHYGITVDNSFGTPGTDTRTWFEIDPYNDIQSWGTAQSTYFTISKGNVGIGTINPTAKLAVNGLMKAKEVNVTISGSDWPDYVFKPDYKQPDLTQLAKDIQQQGHLPGIPSAGEIGESGVNVGVMEAKLLEKIEQLTLLLIEQDKKLTSLQKELDILREKK